MVIWSEKVTVGTAVGRFSPTMARLAFSWATNRLAETRRDLGLEPGRRVRIDRIGDDHALGRHQEHREMEVVLEAVEVAGDLGDRPLGRILCQGKAASESDGQDGGNEHKDQSTHSNLQVVLQAGRLFSELRLMRAEVGDLTPAN
jgi:bifunctional DNA-binding transcriptional regulator/antitoxin component of YhaV-PrlF toxin-antitoxin module